MNPDKLFDYLDGRLSATDRIALEQRLVSDQQLQRELAIARQIHAGMRDDSHEILPPSEVDVSARGRKMALRVGAAFIILMGVNVGAGLWFSRERLVERRSAEWTGLPFRSDILATLRATRRPSRWRAACTLDAGVVAQLIGDRRCF